MRCQSDSSPDDLLRHHSRQSRRCCGFKGRRFKGRYERNLASAKQHREVMKGTTRNLHFVEKFLATSIAVSTFAQLYLFVAGDDLLFGMTTQLHGYRQCNHLQSHSVAY
ncbi:hypothetical protein TNCV_1847971 [Trichonephila clavipes]|nr:hypothetical protein TNCV_1847971 [Trichonephila clavipes]